MPAHGTSPTTAALAVLLAAMIGGAGATRAQGIDCGQLRAQIAQLDRGGGGRNAGAARRQQAEIARTQATFSS